jgi:CO/xanthine dehydrogenase FAD-binding subunit
MRAYLPAFEMKVPDSLPAALSLLATAEHDWIPFAGGTDLMVLLEAGQLQPVKFLSLWHLAELRGIEETDEAVTLGALTTFSQILKNSTLQREFPLLCQAAGQTGAVAIQNRATLGGNIANASPAADAPPALLAYDAALCLMSASNSRWLPYHEFHTGYKQTRLAHGEIISHIRLSRSSDQWKQVYRKVGTRKAQAISKVCFAARALISGAVTRDVRIALGSVAPTPIRCFRTEALLRGRPSAPGLIRDARELLCEELSPVDDFRSTAAYRLTVAGNLLEEFLR